MPKRRIIQGKDIRNDEHVKGLSGMGRKIILNLLRKDEEPKKEQLDKGRALELQDLEERSKTLSNADQTKLKKQLTKKHNEEIQLNIEAA